MAIPLAEKWVEPPEEGPVVNIAGGLGWVAPVLGPKQPALVQGLKHQGDELDYHGSGCEVSNDLIQMVHGA
jgi:hypothetical protein